MSISLATMGMGHGFSAYVLAWHIQQMIFKYICDHLQILVLLHMLCYAVLSHFSCVRLFATLWTVACQAPLSMGILPARILEWVAIPSFRGFSQPRDWTRISCIAGEFFTIWATREALARIWVNSRAVADRWSGTLQSVQMRELFWKWATIALTSFFLLLWISFSLLLFFSEMSPN